MTPLVSPYVKRCQDALAEYDRLRFTGMDHATALQFCGLKQAILGQPVSRQDFDAKAAQAGRDA